MTKHMKWKDAKKQLLKDPRVRFYYYLDKLMFWRKDDE